MAEKRAGHAAASAPIDHLREIITPDVAVAHLRFFFLSELLACMTQAAKAAGLDPLQGHNTRIGSTLECLLRGVPFDVMKVKGRWESDAFSIYLTHHSKILAPYMQDHPEIRDHLVRLTMPHLRR